MLRCMDARRAVILEGGVELLGLVVFVVVF